jgi:preprotein translocase subunit SecA
VSFGDDLMRRFSPDWVPNLLARMGMDEDTPLESGVVSKAIEQAQTKVEGHNFDIRKHVVQYDDVMNQHRAVIYKQRRAILQHADLKENVLELIQKEIERIFDAFAGTDNSEEWDTDSLVSELKAVMPIPAAWTPAYFRKTNGDEAFEEVLAHANEQYEKKEAELGSDRMRTLEQLVFLRVIDRLWVYHLTALEELRQGIGLRGYGQRDPLVEFKREAFDMFEQLNEHIRQNVVRQIYNVTLTTQAARPEPPRNVQESGPSDTAAAAPSRAATAAATATAAGGAATATATPAPGTGNGRPSGKVGRNDPCPCGSGKKYKKCHGTGAVA